MFGVISGQTWFFRAEANQMPRKTFYDAGIAVVATLMNSLKSFFAQPSRQFWPLQICGWLGYFLLYSLAAAGEGKGWDYVRFYFTAALAGFAITSLLRLGYRAIW